jgi:DNA-binding transcriptional ArsR family regulator
MAALSDPTRQEVLERLRHGPKPVGEIAAGLNVSRPAVSQHLKVLKGSGLVVETWIGTRHYFAIDPQGLGQIRAEIDRLWSDALEALQRHIEEGETP